MLDKLTPGVKTEGGGVIEMVGYVWRTHDGGTDSYRTLTEIPFVYVRWPDGTLERLEMPNAKVELECYSCGEMPTHECPASQRPCGHHCNCSWIHDHCHWCGKEWGEGEEG